MNKNLSDRKENISDRGSSSKQNFKCLKFCEKSWKEELFCKRTTSELKKVKLMHPENYINL